MNRNIAGIAAGALLALSLAAQAAEPTAGTTPGVAWSQLSGEQQKLLAPLEGKWATLPPEKQAALAKGATRWESMTPEQRARAKDRFQQWRELPPAEREQLRAR